MRSIAKTNNQNVLDARKDDKIQKMLQENRSKKNIDNGYWVLGTNVEAAKHGVLFEEDSEKIETVILHSDGFNYEILGLSLEEVLNKCKDQKNLENLQQMIREAEENDKYANKHARFKKNDDMAAIIDTGARVQEIDAKTESFEID